MNMNMSKEQKQTDQKFIVGTDSLQIAIKQGMRPYKINWNRLQTESQLIEWISHLSKKNWLSKNELNEFILIVNQHRQFNLLVE